MNKNILKTEIFFMSISQKEKHKIQAIKAKKIYIGKLKYLKM